MVSNTQEFLLKWLNLQRNLIPTTFKKKKTTIVFASISVAIIEARNISWQVSGRNYSLPKLINWANIPINCRPKTVWRSASWINCSNVCKIYQKWKSLTKTTFLLNLLRRHLAIVARSDRCGRKAPSSTPLGNILVKNNWGSLEVCQTYKCWIG